MLPFTTLTLTPPKVSPIVKYEDEDDNKDDKNDENMEYNVAACLAAFGIINMKIGKLKKN